MKKNELSLRELEDFIGGGCVYADIWYAEGETIYLQNGTSLTCSDGKWK